MKALLNLTTRLALAGAAALLTQTTFAQTWETVDDFEYVPHYASEANAMAEDARGNIFAAGVANDAISRRHALVRGSGDQGASWVLLDDYTYPDCMLLSCMSILVDAAQNIYITGIAGTNGPTKRLWLRKSADGGATWATVLDTAAPNAALGSLGTDCAGTPCLATDASGAIYVGMSSGAILKSVNAGVTWMSATEGGWVRGIASTPAGLFAADADTGPWSVVKKSLDGGVNWTTVDSYTPPGFVSSINWSTGGRVVALCADPQANLYVGGWANIKSGTGKHAVTNFNWLIRKGSNGGTSWNTLTPITWGTGQYLNGLGADLGGNLYAAGATSYPITGTNYEHWIVVKSANQGVSWTISDDYFPDMNGGRRAMAVLCDASGGVYVCGGTSRNPVPPGGGRWIVRKQVGP